MLSTVFISLVFHVNIVAYKHIYINTIVLGEGLKPGREALTSGDKSPRLARAKALVSVKHIPHNHWLPALALPGERFR